jgi:hypothetical protein
MVICVIVVSNLIISVQFYLKENLGGVQALLVVHRKVVPVLFLTEHHSMKAYIGGVEV